MLVFNSEHNLRPQSMDSLAIDLKMTVQMVHIQFNGAWAIITSLLIWQLLLFPHFIDLNLWMFYLYL